MVLGCILKSYVKSIQDVAVDQVKEDAELLQIRATQSHFSPQNKAW